MAFVYTGIGSRKTPIEVQELFVTLGKALAKHHIILRSGHAEGADIAFEMGCDTFRGPKEIYLPWRSFNKSTSVLYTPSEEAMTYTKEIHPRGDKLDQASLLLLSRNVHQILGQDLESPSDFIICWTKNGKAKGGTGFSLKVAALHNIKVFNAGDYEDLDLFIYDIKNYLSDNNMLQQ